MALTTVPASLSATALTLTTAAQPNITSVGTLTGLTLSGNLTVNANTNVTGNLTVDTNSFYVDATNNRVGIGTISPDEKLHISGGIKVDGAATMASGAGTGLFLDYSSNVGRITSLDQGNVWRSLRLNAADIQFYIANGQIMTLESTGRLALGHTTTTGAKFAICDGANAQIQFFPEVTTDTNLIQQYDITAAAYINADYRAASHVFKIGTSAALTIDSGGVIRLGPDAQDIQIYPASVNGSNNLIYMRGNAGGDKSEIQMNHYGYADFHIGVGHAAPGAFNIGNNKTDNDFVIDGSGNIGIGTTTPAMPLDVGETGASTSTVAGFRGGANNQINIAHSTNTSWGLLLTNSDGTNNTGYHHSSGGIDKSCAVVNVNNDSLHFGTNNDARLTIDNAGNVGIGTTTPQRLFTLFNNDQPVFQITNNTSGGQSTRGLIMYQMSGTYVTAIDNQGAGSGGEIRFMAAGTEKLRIDPSASAGHLQAGIFGVTGLNTSAAIHGVGNDAALVISNGHLAGTNSGYAWAGRGGRYLTSNGTNWTADGRDPGIVVGSNNSGTTRVNVGIVLHNDSPNDNTFSPAIGFGNKSNSGSYNTMYSYIMGRKVGQGADANWSTGEIHMDTAGTRIGTSTRNAYMADIPAFMMDQHGDINMPYKAYAYGNISGGSYTPPSNGTGFALNTIRYQNCTPQTNASHGPGITITKAGFYVMYGSILYNPAGTYIYIGWAVNGTIIHHFHSNHAIANNHDAISSIGRYLSVGDHVTFENYTQTITMLYGNAHSAWYIYKVG